MSNNPFFRHRRSFPHMAGHVVNISFWILFSSIELCPHSLSILSTQICIQTKWGFVWQSVPISSQISRDPARCADNHRSKIKSLKYTVGIQSNMLIVSGILSIIYYEFWVHTECAKWLLPRLWDWVWDWDGDFRFRVTLSLTKNNVLSFNKSLTVCFWVFSQRM